MPIVLTVLLHGDPLAPQQGRLGAALAARGHRVVVCDAPGVAAAIRQEHGGACEELALPRPWPPLVQRLRAASRVRRLGVDVVHLNYLHPRHLLWSSMSGGPPYVATAWGSDLNDQDFPKSREHDEALTRVLRGAAAITADSVPLLAKARSRALLGTPAELVLWGVDCARFDPAKAGLEAARVRRELGIEGDERIVLSPRQTQPHYRIDRLVRAFAASRFGAEGVLVVKLHGKPAEAPYVEALRTLARELGVEKRLRFAPPVAFDELPALYAVADVAVSLPEADGVPSTFCELLALGVPLVATDLDDYQNVLEDGVRALLVKPGDHDATVAALDRLFDDRALASRLSAAGRAWAAEHADWSRCVDRFEALYVAAIEGREKMAGTKRSASSTPGKARARRRDA